MIKSYSRTISLNSFQTQGMWQCPNLIQINSETKYLPFWNNKSVLSNKIWQQTVVGFLFDLLRLWVYGQSTNCVAKSKVTVGNCRRVLKNSKTMPNFHSFVCTDDGGVATRIKGDFEISSFPGLAAYRVHTFKPWQLRTWFKTFRVDRPLLDVVGDLVQDYGCLIDRRDGKIYRLKYLKR